MADKDGRGGGAVWFIAGLLIGVVGTLVTQRFVQSGGQSSQDEAISSSPAPAVSSEAASSVKPKLVTHPGGLSSAKSLSAAAAAANDDQSPSDVADDAAAAGMTSRAPRPPSNTGQ